MIYLIPFGFILLGLLLALSTRNALVLLIGVEILIGSGIGLILLAGSIHVQAPIAQTYAVIVLSVAAAQAALAFALVLNLYKSYQTVDFVRLRQLSEPESGE